MNYDYICSNCGSEFTKDNDRTKQCPYCGSVWILVSYYEDGNEINIKEYQAIRANVNTGTKVSIQCPDCSHTKETYGFIKGTFCIECGGMPLNVAVDNPLDILKRYRKKNKLSQKLMGWKLDDISQSYYSDIESGRRPMTPEILHWISKNIAK